MVWKELGEALGDLAGTGERVNMVSAPLLLSKVSTDRRRRTGVGSVG